MKANLSHLRPNMREQGEDGGAFVFWRSGAMLRVIASWGGGWDHLSVSCRNRCPTFEELDFVKRLFFREDEVAMQLHVAKADHVNTHPNCLHLWRPHLASIPLPPKHYV